jgi:hypothetical protein
MKIYPVASALDPKSITAKMEDGIPQAATLPAQQLQSTTFTHLYSFFDFVFVHAFVATVETLLKPSVYQSDITIIPQINPTLLLIYYEALY